MGTPPQRLRTGCFHPIRRPSSLAGKPECGGRMAGLRPPVTDIGVQRPPTRQVLALIGLFGLFLLVLAFFGRLGVQSSVVTQAVISAALALFALVAIVAHGRRPANHYAADRAIRAVVGGL